MLGNDVVDLRDPETQAGARHPHFDRRVFAPAERACIARSGAPERLRWILWAAKEAAYKVARKLDAQTLFTPSHFAVRVDETLRGEVALPGGLQLPVWIREEAECVHAIASERPDFEQRLVAGLGALGSSAARDESRCAREFAARELARELGRPADEISIEKRGRIPQLLLAGVDAACDLTLSHHGRFAAFACELTKPLKRIEEASTR
jgi:phosphopantetheinyl transferase (holo-ACP synthase)